METVKLIHKNGDIIERLKIQYEPNENIWLKRGWNIYDETKVVKEPMVEPKVDTEWQPEDKPKKKKSKKKG